MIWAIAATLGLSFALLIWGGRGWLTGKYRRDVEWIRQTWLRFNPTPAAAEVWTIAMYAIFLALLLGLLLFTPHPLIALALWLVCMKAPAIAVEFAWRARRRQIDLQLSPAITAMCNSIRAGLTLVQAVQRLAEQAPEPIRTEFRVMANRYAYGADLESTIREAKARLGLANFNLFASALLLNREMGGDVAETLGRISASLDKMRQMRQTVEAHTSEGRTNIKILVIAPVLMLLMMATVDGPGVRLMFTTPQGYAVLLVAGFLTAIGIYFASKITRTEI